MKTILITAYAINPYKGSEDGTGWNWVNEISKRNKVIAITRENNQAHIERYLAENDLPHAENMQFVYYDLPYWMRFWKKGGRGALLYVYMWQFFMPFFIWKEKLQFDIAHNLNFHANWIPTFLWLLRKPLVWGPVGHHHKIPKDYLLKSATKKDYYIDRLKWYTKCFFWNFDPFLKISKYSSNAILGVNSSAAKVMNSKKVVVIPAVANNSIPHIMKIANKQLNIISVGRFVHLKGFDMAIRAFAKCYHHQPEDKKPSLTLIGKGPALGQLIALAKELNVRQAVDFINWIEREKLNDYFAKADIFLFPSHEGAGMVVPEALSFGVPVIAYDNYGPGEFLNKTCGIKIPYTNYEQSVSDFAKAINDVIESPWLLETLSEGAYKHFAAHLTWKRRGEQIQEIYNRILAPSKDIATTRLKTAESQL